MKLFLATCLGLCLFALEARAQRPDRRPSPEARERWERMTQEERTVLERRFQEFERLPPDARAKLEERSERLRAFQRELVERMRPELREKLAAMGENERREALRRMFELSLRERGRRIRERLPDELRQHLEAAPPDERQRALHEWFRDHREERIHATVRGLGEELGLWEGEIARIQGLQDPARYTEVLELRRQVMARDFAAVGLPPWIDEATWREMELLSTQEFFERFHALRPDGGFQPGGAERADPPGPSPRDLFKPDPAWRGELEQLSEPERRPFLEAKLKARALERLAAAGVPEPDLARLRAAEGEAIFAALRELLRARGHQLPEPRGGFAPEHSGDRGPRRH
jgi:hypothetical protein